jgi:Protein of unknown function (DUF2953)
VPWLAGLTAALAFLLAVPLDVAFEVRRREAFASRVRLRWLWGAVRIPVPAGGGRGAAGPKQRRPAKPSKPARPGRTSGLRRALAVLATPRFPGRVVRLARGLVRRVRFRDLELAARVGLDDPADTGRLWGLLGPVAALLAVPRAARIELVPEFGGAVFHLDARGEARVVPGAVLLTVLAFLLAPATLRAAWAGVRA